MPNKEIFQFLKELAANNNREWFKEHKDEYDAVRTIFEDIVRKLIIHIASFDDTVANLEVKDCIYRIYRDIRFSPDKSPYKRHFGAYFNPSGKQACYGGYYFHLQPGESLVACGTWCLPSAQLKALRQAVVDYIDEFRAIVEAPDFKHYFPQIGTEFLKKMPVGFPKDFPYPNYLRCKDYSCCWYFPDDFLDNDGWIDEITKVFKLMKPFNDFLDYSINGNY